MAKNYVKVPVMMQMEALECGAASLAMILSYYGKWIPLEQVRADCGVSRDGSSAKNILRAARLYGLKAQGYKYEVEDIKKVKYPCIIHWNFNHFVVLNGFKKSKAIINDPARGTVEISMEEFDKAFTGICLQFELGEQFVPDGKPKSVISFARTRLKGTMTPFIFVTLTGILTAIIGVIDPVLRRVFMDRILSQNNPDWLYPLIMLMIFITTISVIVSLIHTLYMLKIEGKLAVVANATFMWQVLCLPMEFFSQRMAGDIAERQSSNQEIAATLIRELAPVVLNFIMLIFYLTVMIRYSLLLTLVGLTTAFLNLFIAKIISQKRINITRVQMRDAGKLAGITVSGIEMIETIKASGAENGFYEKWAGYQAAVNTSTVNYTKLNQYLGAVPVVISQIADIAILILGSVLIIQGSFTSVSGVHEFFYVACFVTAQYGAEHPGNADFYGTYRRCNELCPGCCLSS
jgi:ABC-type bacteriocin/lantibiotic exporter with double-glycine peptidase domain